MASLLQHTFVATVLPSLRRQLRAKIGGRINTARGEDAFADASGLAWLHAVRLDKRGLDVETLAGSIAYYAVLNALQGRGVEGWFGHADPLTPTCERKHGTVCERMDGDSDTPETCPIRSSRDRSGSDPSRRAAAREFFDRYINSRSPRVRRQLLLLAEGERYATVARLTGIHLTAVRRNALRMKTAWEKD